MIPAPPPASFLQRERDLVLQLASARTLEEALWVLMDAACALPSIDCGGVYRRDPADDGLHLVATRGLDRAFIAEATFYGPATSQRAMVATGKPTYLETRPSGRGPFVPTAAMARLGLKALAILPIVQSGQLLGVLNLASRTVDRFRAPERTAMETLSAHGGLIMLRMAALQALRERERLLQELAQRLLVVQEKERQGIATFLHDHLGPLLILARMEVEQAARSHPASAGAMARVEQRLDEAIRGMRHKALALLPPMLEDLGLRAALECLMSEWGASAGVAIAAKPGPELSGLPPAGKVRVYRILQDLLLALRIRKGARVEWSLAAGRTMITLDVVADLTRARGGREGLDHVSQVVSALGGTIKVVRPPGGGMRVTVSLPRGGRRRGGVR